jgi:hypothetical protein
MLRQRDDARREFVTTVTANSFQISNAINLKVVLGSQGAKDE